MSLEIDSENVDAETPVGGENLTVESGEAVTQEETEEVVITIGEEVPEEAEDIESAPAWVKEVRKQNRELQKKVRELEKIKAPEANTQQVVQAITKPTLESCEYDEDEYEKRMDAYYEHQRKVKEDEDKVTAKTKREKEEWDTRLATYNNSKSQLKIKVKDFDEAEDTFKDLFSVAQQGITLKATKNPHHVIYALGKNLKKARELSEIHDPITFAATIALLETELKVSNKKTPPPAEKVITNTTGSVSGTVDSTLDRLRAEAAKTGDFSKVHAHKRKQRGK